MAGLRAHESQTGHMDNPEEFRRGWLARAAAQGGLPGCRLAETFPVVGAAGWPGQRRRAACPGAASPRPSRWSARLNLRNPVKPHKSHLQYGH
jgi:hypothetical protein